MKRQDLLLTLKLISLPVINTKTNSMGESNTAVSAYRHLQQYCPHPLDCATTDFHLYSNLHIC